MKRILLLLLAMALMSASCSQPTDPVDPPTNGFVLKGIEINSIDDIDDVIPLLSNSEKAGQMLQAERKEITLQEITEYNIGSILSGGGSIPGSNEISDWINMYNSMQEASRDSSSGIPLIYGIDAVHGHNNVKNAVLFPHNMALGAANNPELMEEMGKMVAKEVHATGLNWNFAPAVSVVQDIRWGRSYESFSEDPALAAPLGAAYISGIESAGIISTTKHFIGDGQTDLGKDQGDVSAGFSELLRINQPVYDAAIEAGTKTIMATYNSVDGIKVHGRKDLLTTQLRDIMGFEGLIVSDWLAVDQIDSNLETSVITAVNAGIDLLMQPHNWKEVYDIILANMGGAIPMTRINDAVKKNLILKYQAGLLTNDYIKEAGAIGTQEVRDAARNLVSESLVQLKNDNSVLPLQKNMKVYLTGPASDSVGIQAGGWSISWQGSTFGDYEGGTTLQEAMAQVLGDNGGELVSDPTQADVIILAIGESPYAEGAGDDRTGSALSIRDGVKALAGNGAAIDSVANVTDGSGNPVPVVTIIIAGRPMLIDSELADWDALVMAWLPGTEGLGMTDVLFGDKAFKGTLPVTWPRSIDQADDSIMMDSSRGGTGTYDSSAYQFPIGFSFP